MKGINSFYYSKLIKFKKKVLDILFKFLNSNLENVSLPTRDIAMLFLVDHNNINKLFYNNDDLKITNYFCNELYKNNVNLTKISKDEATKLVNLATNKRYTINYNTELAIMIANLYNENNKNKLQRIKLDIFRNICNSIDD